MKTFGFRTIWSSNENSQISDVIFCLKLEHICVPISALNCRVVKGTGQSKRWLGTHLQVCRDELYDFEAHEQCFDLEDFLFSSFSFLQLKPERDRITWNFPTNSYNVLLCAQTYCVYVYSKCLDFGHPKSVTQFVWNPKKQDKKLDCLIWNKALAVCRNPDFGICKVWIFRF